MNQLRDEHGRFTKQSSWDRVTIPQYDLSEEEPLPVPKKVWLSHHRVEIALHIGYFLLCFLVGLYGGYVGVSGKLTP